MEYKILQVIEGIQWSVEWNTKPCNSLQLLIGSLRACDYKIASKTSYRVLAKMSFKILTEILINLIRSCKIWKICTIHCAVYLGVNELAAFPFYAGSRWTIESPPPKIEPYFNWGDLSKIIQTHAFIIFYSRQVNWRQNSGEASKFRPARPIDLILSIS